MTTLFKTNRWWRIKLFATALFSAALVLLLPACVEEQITPPDNGTTITFSVRAPKDFSPTSYALSGEEEEDISTVDVLLFKDDKYFSGPHYGVINGSDVTIRIPSAASDYNMAVFANCRAELNQVFSTSSTKADVLASLTRTVTVGSTDGAGTTSLDGGEDAGWLTSTGNKTIPMYGEYATGQTVNLVRMLARINVAIASEDKDGNPITVPFTLSEVYLCNYNNKGQIAPASNWTESTPTVVPSVQQTTFAKSIKYTAVAANKLEREIYTFEANAGDAANLPTNTCLVIGGKYDGSSTTTYYRIDFVDNSDTYLPLLRNHTYETVVSKIGGPGYGTPEDAFNSRPVNIEYDIVDWDGSEVVNVVYDGQYMLGVSQNSFTFDNSERTSSNTDNTITVTTNYPTAWTVSVPTQSPAGWLTATKSDNTVQLTCVGTTSERTATVRITAGRMVQDISVTQIKDAVAITFNGAASTGEVLYESVAGVQPDAKSFSVSWTPADADVSFTKTTVGSTAFAISSGTSIDNSGTLTGGSASYTDVRPSSYSDFMQDRASAINYTLTYGGVTVTKSLVLRQRVIVPFFNVTAPTLGADYYLLNSSGITINFDTNVPWKVTFTPTVINGSGSLSIDKTSGSAGAGQSVKITGNGTTALGGIVELKFSSQTPGQFAEVTVPLPFSGTKSGGAATDVKWAGSNIYYDSDAGHLTFAGYDSSEAITDKENYQGVYFQWGSLYGIAATGSSTSFTTSGTNATLLFPPWGGAVAFDAAVLQNKGITTWEAIPRVTTSLSYTADNYLYYRTDDISDQQSAARGDICRWLTLTNRAPAGNWRMPTATEMAASTSTWPIDLQGTQTGPSWSATTPSNSEDNRYGKNPINVGRYNFNPSDDSKPFFPAAGYRFSGGGTLSNVGSVGHYWPSSPSNTYARYLNVNSSTVSSPTGSHIDRAYGCTIRCVQD